MATMSATLRMFDAFAQPLQNITQSLNSCLSAMNELTNASARNAQITNLITSAQLRLALVEAELQVAASSAANAQAELNNHFTTGQVGAKGFISSIKSLLGEYLTLQRLKDLGEATIGGAMEQRKTQDMFIARTGDREIGTAMFDKFKKEALAAGQDVNKSLQSSLSFFSSTQNVDQLTKLNNLTQRLNAFDTSGNGIEGAASALNEAMSGDITSLGKRFNMSKSDIQAFKIDELGKSGDIDGFIGAFEQLLEKRKMGQAAFDEIMKSPAKQMEVFTNNMNSSFANAGVQALDALAPLIIMLNDAFQEGKFQPFFDGLSAGLSIVVGAIREIAYGAAWLGNIIHQNWGMIAPIVMGVVAAFLIYNAVLRISALWMGISAAADLIMSSMKAAKARTTLAAVSATAAETASQWGLNAALLACPMTWIILGVIALIAIFYAVIAAVNKFAGTSISATGIIAGAFMFVAAVIGNIIVAALNLILDSFAIIWNFLALFAEFFANVLNDPVGSIVRLFAGMADSILEILEAIASAIDTLFGQNLAESVSGWRSSLQGIVTDLVGEAKIKIPRLDTNSSLPSRFQYGDAINKGYNWGENLSKKFSLSNLLGTDKDPDAFNPDNWNNLLGTDKGLGAFNSDSWNQNSNINRVNEVGRIENTVDISSEDIKTMRELAEMKNIQNFVTLTPTANYMHNGDVNNGQNVDTIITKIKTMLETEIVSSTNGVFPI